MVTLTGGVIGFKLGLVTIVPDASVSSKESFIILFVLERNSFSWKRFISFFVFNVIPSMVILVGSAVG